MARPEVSRREFVSTAGAAFGAMVVPRHVLGGPGFQAPSDTLNVALVGVGGVGLGNAESLVTQNIVALCDVDFGYVDRQLQSRLKDREGKPRPEGVALQEKLGRARRYADYREMLEKQRDIEGVVIATPDHAHAAIAKAAMEAGKHVYVQKPLTYSVHEARVLRDLARKLPKVVTQMGNQGHSSHEARLVNEWIAAGLIGPVRGVHVWTNRPIWPQGLPRPAQATDTASPASWSRRSVSEALARSLTGGSPPATLDWKLYLGPIPDVPYHPIYHPFNWRGWVDFGVGALGDMGAHLIDHPYWALGLRYPVSVESTSTPWGGPASAPASYPVAMLTHYEFPERPGLPPVRLSWYDGGLMPPRPAVLPDAVPLNQEGGVIFVGEKGILMHETYGRNPQLYPAELMQVAAAVPQTMKRIEGSHEQNWVDACRGRAEATSPFEYAAPLTEVMLLGIVALRAGQGRKIRYDGESGTVPGAPDVEPFLTREYRAGFAL
ncbi:MAG TPA: Gfo/Idh/MocA family oxidoreductase [Gemmatimonadales bacterium]|nr:Gfo/Idh/MocA family oxidoreductase [Gemmatimonadales bacterium]